MNTEGRAATAAPCMRCTHAVRSTRQTSCIDAAAQHTHRGNSTMCRHMRGAAGARHASPARRKSPLQLLIPCVGRDYAAAESANQHALLAAPFAARISNAVAQIRQWIGAIAIPSGLGNLDTR